MTKIDIEGVGTFVKAGPGFDIDEFLNGSTMMGNGNSAGSMTTDSSQNGAQNGMTNQSGIIGTWYETTGYGGTLNFLITAHTT